MDLVPLLAGVSAALEGDAVVLELKFVNGAVSAKEGASRAAGGKRVSGAYQLEVNLKLASVITKADEAVQTARKIEKRLKANFDKGFTVTMVTEPVGAQAAKQLSGGFSSTAEAQISGQAGGGALQEAFRAGYLIERSGP